MDKLHRKQNHTASPVIELSVDFFTDDDSAHSSTTSDSDPGPRFIDRISCTFISIAFDRCVLREVQPLVSIEWVYCMVLMGSCPLKIVDDDASMYDHCLWTRMTTSTG